MRALANTLDLSEDERDALIASAPKRAGMIFTPPAGREDPAPTLPVMPTPLIGRERTPPRCVRTSKGATRGL